MTVPSSANRSGPYNGNGVTTVFNYGFRILDENHLTVIKTVGGVETVLVIDADYIVSDVGADAGGQVAISPAPASGSTITILRNVPFTQETELENQGPYFAKTVEKALDRGVMRDQQLSERLDRAVTIPASANGSTLNELIENVLRLADSADEIDVVASNVGAVNIVASNIAAVNTAADNIGAIIDAPNQAASAAQSAADAAAVVAGALQADANLADLDDAATARDNLGVTAALAALDNVKRDDLTGPTLAMPAIHIKSRVHDIFSVMEVFDNDTQRDEIRSRASALDAGPYINAATDYAVRRGYGVVEFPFGTYLLKGVRNGAYSRSLIIARSGLSLVGREGSVIKIDDDVTRKADTTTIVGSVATYDYRIIAPVAADASAFDTAYVDDFAVEGLSFDCNGANNTVAGSSIGGEIRRGYVVSLPGGKRIKIRNNKVKDCPGRNVFSLSSATLAFDDLDISWNRIRNVGAAIAGNGNQNDHSSIYTVAGTKCSVAFNTLYMDAPVDPSAVNAAALEIHGSNTDVIWNTVVNYPAGGNCVSLEAYGDGENHRWENNRFRVTRTGIAIWNMGSKHIRPVYRNNRIEIDSTTYQVAGGGILQYQDNTRGLYEIIDPRFEDNHFICLKTDPHNNTQHGIQLCALRNGKVTGNKGRNLTGDLVAVLEPANNLNIRGLEIKGNEAVNCGMGSGGSRPWSIYVQNGSTSKTFENIEIDDNVTEAELQPVGSAPLQCRGFRVTGPGYLRNVVVGGKNRFRNIQRAQRVEIVSTTENIAVQRLPHEVSAASAAPVSGHFENGGDFIRNTTWAGGGSGFMGAVPVSGGSASSATWAGTTAYKAGQWIKLANGRVIEYTVGGTSGASEPNPTVLMQQYTDGTATFVYRDSASAAFKTYGVIAT